MSDASRLTPEQLAGFREELEAELLRLERSMLVSDEGLKPVEVDPGTTGRLSRMDELQSQAMTRNLREREEMKLGGLLQALRRVEDGTYGLCTECGAAIPLARLEVFPEVATCMACTA